MGVCRISANITTKYRFWTLLSKKYALKMFFYYIACFWSGYRSCTVAQMANFKDLIYKPLKCSPVVLVVLKSSDRLTN